MLAALNHQEADYVPCCFMIFAALRSQCRTQFEFVERQLALGLDATVDLPLTTLQAPSDHADLHGLPVRFHPQVEVKEWWGEQAGERYPLLYKEYVTPAGTLRTEVRQTDDWPYGNHVPFLDDYLIPRSRKFLVTARGDLPPLRYLFTPPSAEDLRTFREGTRQARDFAARHGLLVTGGWGSVADTACWLCGIPNLLLLAIDESDFVEELLTLLAAWNRQRMEVILEGGVDLFIRRGWYETADFWSPHLYRRFIFPSLQQEAELAHQAGAKFGYIMTTGVMPLLDLFVEAGVDVLIGIDPVQGKGTDLPAVKQKLGGKVCLWGGVNGFLTVERGTPAQVREAVHYAIATLAPGGGFILSPVDNVRDTSQRTWENVRALLEAWREVREYPV